MAEFKRKIISRGQTVADRLKKARLEKNLNLKDLSQKIKIQVKYLEQLENGDYQKLPGEIYLKTWLKMYAQEVELPANELLRDYKLEKIINAKVSYSKRIKKINWHNLLKPKVLKWSVVLVVVLIFLIYLGWEINNIIAPPQIEIIEPVNNFQTTASSVMIVGKTKPEVQLKINNETILLDEQGNFRQEVNLSIGLNNLQISAKKKHSKTNLKELTVLRETTE